MLIENPRYNADGTVDCEIEHPQFGWIPFTASPDDTEAYGREIYARALAGEFGTIAPYVEPEPVSLTWEQVQALRRAAYVTESDPLKNEAEFDALTAGVKPDYSAWMNAVAEIKARYPLPEPASS